MSEEMINESNEVNSNNTGSDLNVINPADTKMTSSTHDVFISYSSINKNVADMIVSEFEQHNIRCWYAPRDIMPGEQWVTAITEALAKAKVFVLIFTDESNESKQVMNEVALAFNNGLTIVPFRLTEEVMNSELEYYLTRVHWLDAFNKPLNNKVSELREYINVILHHEKYSSDKNNAEAVKNDTLSGQTPIANNISNDISADKKVSDKKSFKKSSDGKKKKIIPIIAIALAVVAVIGFFVLAAGGLSAVIIGNSAFGSSKYMKKGLEYYNSKYHSTEDNQSARDCFEKAAKKREADAYYYLGKLDAREYNYEGAKEHFETGVSKGSDLARLGLGSLYLEGNGVAPDIEKTNELYDEALANGCMEANYYEGILWARGLSDDGDDADANKALEYYQKTLDYYENNLEKTDSLLKAEILCSMGDIYKKGFAGVDKDPETAKDYYEQSMSCCAYYEGNGNLKIGDLLAGLEKNVHADEYYVKALRFYENAAGKGDIPAMNKAGYMYSTGRGCETDEQRIEKAINYYYNGAMNGNYVSIYNLGSIYQYGKESIESNPEEAYKYYKMAADAGYAQAMYQIGLMYFNGEYKDSKESETPEDPNLKYSIAKQWYERAVENGYYDAYVDLGNMYLEGKGVEVNPEEAKKQYQLGIDKGNSNCMAAMGYYYTKDTVNDYNKAYELYTKAAYAGSNLAEYNLGILYKNGWGVKEPDYEEAEKWFMMAAEDDYTQALTQIGMLYEIPLSGSPDYASAKKWYEKAAYKGEAWAMVLLGEIYFEGYLDDSHEPDYENAYYMYKNALDKVDILIDEIIENCNNDLGICCLNLGNKSLEENDIQKARGYYKEGAEKANADCCIKLGDIYFSENNMQSAKECYEAALENGSNECLIKLGNIYYAENNSQKAKEYYESGVEKGLNLDDKATENLGNIYYDEGNQTEAITYYEMIWESSAIAAARIGIMYYDGIDEIPARKDDAEKYLLKAEELGFDDSDVFNRIANLYYDRREHLKSAEYFEKEFALTNNPDIARAVGVEYYNANDYNLAAKWYATALENGYEGTDNLKVSLKNMKEEGKITDEEILEIISKWIE
ncbi:MAG: TIR domain-containing protein [Lachnospiraceae bacterium]|nr:TIR domain-containing protein [Lachnospiraceae bacterium]